MVVLHIFDIYLYSRLLVVLNSNETLRQALVIQAEDFSDRPASGVFTMLGLDVGKQTFIDPYNQVVYITININH